MLFQLPTTLSRDLFRLFTQFHCENSEHCVKCQFVCGMTIAISSIRIVGFYVFFYNAIAFSPIVLFRVLFGMLS